MVGTGIVVGGGRLFKINNSRDWNNSRGRKNFQNLIIVGTGIIVGGGKMPKSRR